MVGGIREVHVDKDAHGNYEFVRLVFGPHYFVELRRGKSGSVSFARGATHHGFQADASEVNGELERIIEEARSNHPGNRID